MASVPPFFEPKARRKEYGGWEATATPAEVSFSNDPAIRSNLPRGPRGPSRKRELSFGQLDPFLNFRNCDPHPTHASRQM